jgi:hypothetical protein
MEKKRAIFCMVFHIRFFACRDWIFPAGPAKMRAKAESQAQRRRSATNFLDAQQPKIEAL